jgi:hypothetical protein
MGNWYRRTTKKIGNSRITTTTSSGKPIRITYSTGVKGLRYSSSTCGNTSRTTETVSIGGMTKRTTRSNTFGITSKRKKYKSSNSYSGNSSSFENIDGEGLICLLLVIFGIYLFCKYL